eukprot:6175870-Pleurochrysis_carterae.AAC.1
MMRRLAIGISACGAWVTQSGGTSQLIGESESTRRDLFEIEWPTRGCMNMLVVVAWVYERASVCVPGCGYERACPRI